MSDSIRAAEKEWHESTIMNDLVIRSYQSQDEAAVIELWLQCNLVVPQNNPERDIKRKLQASPEWFLVGSFDGKIVATCMAGYEGHRGWINYLAVSPQHRRKGIGRRIMEDAEKRLKSAGCPKINLQVRETNREVILFYARIGYTKDPVVSMGKRLTHDGPFSRAGSK